ncbi:MAG: SDR family oxidoreductase [Gordonia sp. (in: high G+C Gram-positive bacteria)]
MTSVGIVTGAGRGMGFECAQKLVDLVDHLLLIDLNESTVTAAAETLAARGRASTEAFVLDICDLEGLARLADRVGELGDLRAVAHAAGISPTMADWRRIFEVDLIGTARLAAALRPLARKDTATVCFSSMSVALRPPKPIDAAVDALMVDPLGEDFLDRIREISGEDIESTSEAYPVAKRGVRVFVQQEAVRLGSVGARICSVSPGVTDTPQGRQEAAAHPSMQRLIDATPLARMGRPEEVADVAVYTLTDDASFLNGVDLLVDGGVVAALATRSRRS